MENIATTIIGLISSIISLITAIIQLKIMLKEKKDKEIPTISVRRETNSVKQDNSMHSANTYIEHKQTVYVSFGNSSTSKDDGILMMFGIGTLLMFLYTNRIILLQVMYIPLIITALLSVLICIFYVKRLFLTPIHPSKAINVFFALIPVFISVVFVVQNNLFLYEIESDEFAQKLQIGTTILFDYVGIFFLLFTQLCVLAASRVKFPKIRRFMMNFSRLWPASAILPIVPIVLWFLQR